MKDAFDFGSNWRAYSDKKLDEVRVGQAVQSLKNLLQCETLEGCRFLDVGCGSGLFSIAAHKIGASRVVGIDINPECVTTSERNRDLITPGAEIVFRRVSALDPKEIELLGEFDVAYAWGSLHHTGAMWTAIQIVAQQVAPRGDFVLAIYNQHVTSPIWKKIKWFYNPAPQRIQSLMTFLFAPILYLAKLIVTRRNPLQKERGMDFWYDVIDWIGGYPYEYATPQKVEDFASTLGFRLKHFVPAQVPTGCNEFVFVRVSK